MIETSNTHSKPLARFPFLDGMRAMSVLWLVGFHSLWFLGFFLSQEKFLAIVKSGLPAYLLLCGHLGVDVFFVLSGFLITHVLIEGRARSVSILHFYRRRAFRILPAYFACLLLYSFSSAFLELDLNLQNIWANLLFVNNLLPVANQAMSWTWSLAIEEQFYIVFPLVYFATTSRRRLISYVIGLIVVAILIRTYVIVSTGPWLVSPFHPKVGGQAFFDYFDTLYGKTHMRFGGLLAGILARAVLDERNFIGWLKNKKNLNLALVVAASAAIFYVVLNPLFSFVLNWNNSHFKTANLILERYLLSFGLSYLIFHLIAISSPNRWITRALSHKGWRPVAELSYSAFLLNPLTISFLAFSFRDKLESGGTATLVAFVGLCYVLTFFCAFLIYQIVEKPARKYGNRSNHKKHLEVGAT